MNYTIDIIDQLNDELVLSIEKAVRSGVVLSWKEGDTITSSQLDLSVIAKKYEDGYFLDLFTSDEDRYFVRVYDENDATVWSGFLLPDQYSEPFTNTPVVDFTATDGIGLLKGKYLPKEFYEEERSVIKIYATILQLTSLDLDIRFAPAIENSVQKDYDLIYLNGPDIFTEDKGKKKDAYECLNILLESMVCRLKQYDNYWNIEGWNIEEQRVFDTKIYSPSGIYAETVTITRRLIPVNGLATPNISIKPPFGRIEVDFERKVLEFPETIYKESNDGWTNFKKSGRPVNDGGGVYPTEWFAEEGAKLTTFDDNVVIPFKESLDSEAMVLRSRPYITKGASYVIDLDIKYEFDGGGLYDAVPGLIDEGYFLNMFHIWIYISYIDQFGEEKKDTLFSNLVGFEDDYRYIPQNLHLDDYNPNGQLAFIPNNSGNLEIRFSSFHDYGIGDALIGFYGAYINNLTIEKKGDLDTYNSVIELQDDYTVKKELSLEVSDDSTGLSNAFRLQKLTEKNIFNVEDIPILRQFEFSGSWYSIVDLRGANLIKENLDSVRNQGNLIDVLDVIYNFGGSQYHVVKLAESIAIGGFSVYIYDYNKVIEKRDYWEQWSDSFYKVELKRYADSVADIFNRYANIPLYEMKDFEFNNNAKISDVIEFQFKDKKEWTLGSCRWDMDAGITQVNAKQRYYVVNENEPLAPIVEAGTDYYTSDKAAQLYSNAYDPDGFIVSYFWEELTNSQGSLAWYNMQNPLFIFGDGNYYARLKVTVTDNNGQTASDEVDVYRFNDLTMSLSSNIITPNYDEEYTLVLANEPAIGTLIAISGFIECQNKGVNVSDSYCYVEIFQNGVSHSIVGLSGPLENNTERLKTENFSLIYITGDVIMFKLHMTDLVDGNSEADGTTYCKFSIDNANYVLGVGNVFGLSLSRMLTEST